MIRRKKYRSLTEKSLSNFKEDLKGYIPQKEAISLLDVAFNTFKRYLEGGQLERIQKGGAYWVLKKDVLKLLEEQKASQQARQVRKSKICLLDLSETKFLLSLVDSKATEKEKEVFKVLQGKLQTHLKNLKEFSLKG